MVRRQRDSTTEEDDVIPDSPPSKKHRTHRHRKHKRRREEDVDTDSSLYVAFEEPLDPEPDPDPAFSLPVKRDQPCTSAAQLLKAQSARGIRDKPQAGPSMPPSPKQTGRKKRRRESATSSEEERWLDAIKSGKLEEVDDELKKIKPKDPKMMTARQRAMYERGSEKYPNPGGEVLMALPSGYKEKIMTAEAIQKAAIKSQKRKQLADEKREKDKKKTMDRLLKKQESKNAKSGQKGKSAKKIVPTIIYKNSNVGISLSLPVGIDFPLEKRGPIEPPIPIKCGVSSCPNLKKYNCSKTNVPLCSLECYKKNLQIILA